MIDLRCASAEEVITDVRGASLIVADPPWEYRNTGLSGAACGHYSLSTVGRIRDVLHTAHLSALPNARLAMWATWPLMGEWMAATASKDRAVWAWGAMMTGGAWLKDDRPGMGFHWTGDTEPVLVYVRGAPDTTPGAALSNGYASRRSAHSEKPADWMRGWLRRWTKPGDLVLDLYAGLAPLAHACAAEGRRYVGAEMDPDRHAQAMEGLMTSGLIRSAMGVRQVGLFGRSL